MKTVFKIAMIVLLLALSVPVGAQDSFVKGSQVEVTTVNARFLCIFQPGIRVDGWNETVGLYFPNDESIMTQTRDCTLPLTDKVLSVAVFAPDDVREMVVCDSQDFIPAYLTSCKHQ